jgi:predicted RNA methylase
VLLDMDDRLAQFYAHGNGKKRRTLYKFNMANGAFLGDAGGDGTTEENEAQLRAVFGKADCVLFDPPFGLRVELLANTLRLITDARRAANAADTGDVKKTKGAKKGAKECAKEGATGTKGLSVMLFLPHFMSARVKLELPGLEMLDYPIEYQVSE